MTVSKKSKARKRRHKKIKSICLTFCLLLVFFIAIYSGFKIGTNVNNKNVKIFGSLMNDNNSTNSKEDKNSEPKEANINNNPEKSDKAENTKNIPKTENPANNNGSSYNGDKEPSKPAISNVSYAVNVEEAFKKDGKKTAFLTFDDGPSKDVTPKILNILEKNNIKATFFVTGQMAEENKELLIQEYKSGNSIGNHSYSHNYKKVYSGIDGFKQEFDTTNSILKSILGESFNSRLFRFPGGSFEKYKNPYKDYVRGKGYVYIDWNALNGDAEGVGFSAERLINRLKSTAGGQEDLVILMHDAAGKKSTAEALPTIIEYLKAQGYEFKILK